MTDAQADAIVAVLEQIAVALERQADTSDQFLEHAQRPRPLFTDYDSGFAAGAAAARAEFAEKISR